MTPGGRRSVPGRDTGFSLPALLSFVLHGVALAGVFWLVQRPAREEPVPERGVEIVWEQEAGEAVSEADLPEAPGAPPEVAAPRQAEAPPPVPEPPMPPPFLAPPAPPRPIAQASPPSPPLALPPLELPLPDLTVAPPPPEPPREEQQALAAPPAPEPPPPEPPLPEPPPLEPPPQELAPPEPRPPEPRPQRPRPTPPARPVQARPQPPAETARPGGEAAAQHVAGIGRATGAVTPPGPDARYQNVAPAYPEAARLRGEQGTVVLEIAVGNDGRAITVTVARGSGSPMLDGAARRAVQEWRFRPAMRDGEAVPGTIRTSVHFRLQ